MASDLQKTIAGALLFGASALTGNALLMTAAGGIGVNWTSEGLAGLWQRVTMANAPASPLPRVARRSLEHALKQVEEAYGKETSRADPDTFRELRGCVAAFDGLVITQPADLATAQRDLISSLEQLLGERPALDFVKAHLLPTAAQAFRSALAGDDEAWRIYHGWLLERLASQMAAHDLRSAQALERAEAVLTRIASHEQALAELQASAERLMKLTTAVEAIDSVTFENRGLDVGGELVQAGANIVLGEQVPQPSKPHRPERPPRDVAFRNEDVKVKGNTYQTAGNVIRRDRAGAAVDLPDTFVLTLHFSPTPTGAQVRWSADEIGAFTSAFTSPFPGPALPAVLRALEQRQHPAFALEPGDTAQFAALGLLTEDNTLPSDLPRRVGRALYTALVSGQGIAALAVAQAQAAQTNRPLALRLLLPPDAVQLAALPWELLWADGPAPLLLSATPGLLLTRHLDRPDPLPPLTERRGRPLRILALTPHAQRAPGDLAAIQRDLAALWAELRAAGTAEVIEVSPVTRADLARAMRHKPDIVQFTGHGWYADGRGVLMLDPAAASGASADRVAADEVAVAVRGARMVLLAACRGGQSAGITGGAASLLSGVAPALSALGVPIVVGMQLGLRVGSALQAGAAIYSALAAGHSAQAAVGRARDELYVAETQDGAWYVPVLYVATRDAGPVYV